MAELKIISMDEVPVEEVEWLWYPYIPFGKLTIIHGDGGEGKPCRRFYVYDRKIKDLWYNF